MRLDKGSLAFNLKIGDVEQGGTPSWGTAIVVQDDDNRIKSDVAGDILIAMVHRLVPITHALSLPLGKGSKIYYGDDDFRFEDVSRPILAARFDKVIVNNRPIGESFILLIVKDQNKDHKGRLQLKYSDKIKYGVYSNELFFSKVRSLFNLEETDPWLIYDISVKEQDTLCFKADFLENTDCLKSRSKFDIYYNSLR